MKNLIKFCKTLFFAGLLRAPLKPLVRVKRQPAHNGVDARVSVDRTIISRASVAF